MTPIDPPTDQDLPIETPEADRLEQNTPARPLDDDELPVERRDLPAEADEGDTLEQDSVVEQPDDDYR